MSPLGSGPPQYSLYSAVVAGFDVVAAAGLRDPGVMEKVLGGLDETWEAAVSKSGYFGFIYGGKTEMVKDLGTFLSSGASLHAPYAAQFRVVGTRFRVNLVICQAGTAAGMAEVQRYYENLTGNRGITILLVPDDSGTDLAAVPSMSPALQRLVQASGVSSSHPRVAYLTFGAAR